MTERQKRFIDFYIKTGNASEAARSAGYSDKMANRIGTENLSKPVISREIAKRLKELESSRTADLKETLEYMTAVMRGEKEDVVVVTVGTGKGFSKSEIVKVPISTRDRLKAAEYLAKIHGAFKTEIQVSGTVPIVISGGGELED
ncbi:MAG: terminase small subunit [Selenomonadaceae bacterium]|nr:terminase small subunit [Selenomonadaceae bacterium]